VIAIDSNILIYAEGVNDPVKGANARACLVAIQDFYPCIPVQALGEVYRVLVRKVGLSTARASMIIRQLQTFAKPLPTTQASFNVALDLANDHKLQIWDAIILAVAAENECKCLLSEDMQDSFIWRGVEIINPLTTRGLYRLNDALKVN
jgi:predicted nucleic acid-binding protein